MSIQPWQRVIEAEESSVPTLRRLYIRNRANPGFLPDVAELLEVLDEGAACSALWILKTAAEDGMLGDREIAVVARSVGASRHWAWRLLLCQLFARVDCPESERENVFEFLVQCFTDRRIIIRAWALSAMWPLRRDPRFRSEVQRCLRAARRDPRKAMQARLRHLE